MPQFIDITGCDWLSYAMIATVLLCGFVAGGLYREITGRIDGALL